MVTQQKVFSTYYGVFFSCGEAGGVMNILTMVFFFLVYWDNVRVKCFNQSFVFFRVGNIILKVFQHMFDVFGYDSLVKKKF